MVLVFAGIVTVFIDDLRPVESVHVIRGEIDSFPVWNLFDQNGKPVMTSTARSDVFFFASANQLPVVQLH